MGSALFFKDLGIKEEDCRMNKEKIKPLYSEFQGYLSQAPDSKNPNDTIFNESLWNQYNETLDLLRGISGEDYSRFKIQPEKDEDITFIYIATYRQKLSGLISHLHGRYFSDELPPFSGMPTTVITQTQQQNQSIQMLLEIQDQIDKKIADLPEESKERKFLEKFKGTLGSISNVTQLLSQMFKIAKDFGLDINSFMKIFG
jgi:hypothetical protein